ncbi:MAG: inositol monophosphatase family protein [Planctomycetota bacterium]|jgi:myo-inositol-1(or 4)-monophosphatase
MLIPDSEGSCELDWGHATSVAFEAARRAGSILREMLDKVVVREKSINDLVTDADLASQHAIQSILMNHFPDHGFLGEESLMGEEMRSSGWQWVVDPLDGTTNYAHGLRNFCVSIALLHHRKPVLGVILDPMAQELFSARAGGGAFIQNADDPQAGCHPLVPSPCATLQKALVAVSFPPQMDRDSPEIRRFLEVLLHSQSIRRLGSAALNLCFVACGRLDAYFGSHLKIWDVAAASLIAQEAGVRLARYDGGDFDPWQGQVVAAANSPLLGELLKKLGGIHAAGDADPLDGAS